MEELEKHELIQSCETIDEIKDAIEKIGPITFRTGSTKTVEEMKVLVDIAYKTGPIRVVTRNYGIRQQILYIIYSERMEKLKEDMERIKMRN